MGTHFSKVYSAELDGVNARIIEIEVDLNVGLHAFTIVGLADKALNEAKERVNSALKNSNIRPPNQENRRITINLAPAEVRKTGAHYDLAIALGYLLATKQIKDFSTEDKVFLGELSLDGTIRPIRGALNITEVAARLHYTYIFLPVENISEVTVIKDITIVPISSLQQIMDILEERTQLPLYDSTLSANERLLELIPDIADIKGQEHAKRALMISAAGGHNIL